MAKQIRLIEDCDDYKKGDIFPVTELLQDEDEHLYWVEFAIDEDSADFYYFRKSTGMAYIGENNDIPFAVLEEVL